MAIHQRLSLRFFPTVILVVLLGAALAQPHPYSGTYTFRDGRMNHRVEIHVAVDNSVSGWYGYSFLPTYFEGVLDGNVATGTHYALDTMQSILFRFEFAEDVLTSYVYPSGTELPEPVYLLRQPGPGPAEAIPAPLDVLLSQRRLDEVVATGATGVTYRLINGLHYVDLVSHALNEGGLDGYAFPDPYLLPMLHDAILIFQESPPEVQSMLADSETWRAAIETGWQDAPAAVQNRILADILQLTFDADELASLHADPTLAITEAGEHHGLVSSLVAAVSLQELRQAQARQPCFYLLGCEDQP